ncbi:MAG TPA: hypothetical protein VIZ65_10260 [Cellvibrionaceae bacterium]
MRLSAEQLHAQGFAYYRAPNVPAAGRIFDAVAKSQSEFEVVGQVSSSGASRSYSPPVTQVRAGAGLFQAVANLAPSVPVIDVYV